MQAIQGLQDADEPVHPNNGTQPQRGRRRLSRHLTALQFNLQDTAQTVGIDRPDGRIAREEGVRLAGR